MDQIWEAKRFEGGQRHGTNGGCEAALEGTGRPGQRKEISAPRRGFAGSVGGKGGGRQRERGEKASQGSDSDRQRAGATILNFGQIDIAAFGEQECGKRRSAVGDPHAVAGVSREVNGGGATGGNGPVDLEAGAAEKDPERSGRRHIGDFRGLGVKTGEDGRIEDWEFELLFVAIREGQASAREPRARE